MLNQTIQASELFTQTHWRSLAYGKAKKQSVFPLMKIGELAFERKESLDPQQLTSQTINYLGLENVWSHAGLLQNFHPKKTEEVKSRSKCYQGGDVLFGRLRPNLNKVLVAGQNYSPGLCSNEFIILVPNLEKLSSLMLQAVLMSKFVTSHTAQLLSGSALPRIHVNDLLEITVPLPPIKLQKELEKQIRKAQNRLQKAHEQVQQLPQETTKTTNNFLEKSIS